MAVHHMEAVFFVEIGPEIELRDGLFHVCYTIGNYRFDVVLPPHAYLKALRAANRCAELFHAGERNVVHFRPIDAEEEAQEA